MSKLIYLLVSGLFLLMYVSHSFFGTEWFASAVRYENPSAPVYEESSSSSRSFFYHSSGGYSGGK